MVVVLRERGRGAYMHRAVACQIIGVHSDFARIGLGTNLLLLDHRNHSRNLCQCKTLLMSAQVHPNLKVAFQHSEWVLSE